MAAAFQQREYSIRQYMQGWLSQSEERLLAVLSPGVHIIESYCPEYVGANEVR